MAARTWGGRTTYGGKRVNWGLYYIIMAALKMLATPHFGGERDNSIRMYQGSWSSGSQSAGTHTGPSALDCSSYNRHNRVLVFRLLGCAAWFRAKSSRWIAHIHLIVCGDGDVHWLAAQQVREYWREPPHDGLAGSGRDNGPKMYGARPLFIFPLKESGKPRTIECVTACHAYTRQTTKAPHYGAQIQVGTRLKIVAFTRDARTGKRWGLTAEGRCVYADNFKNVA